MGNTRLETLNLPLIPSSSVWKNSTAYALLVK